MIRAKRNDLMWTIAGKGLEMEFHFKKAVDENKPIKVSI